jgi:predicted membrane-bound spermidine synthase
MITLRRLQTPQRDIAIILQRCNGAVSYLKNGVLQSLVDAQGVNAAPHIDAAVTLLARDDIHRVLVLGHGGGAATTLLHKKGLEVVSIDCDACSEGLGRLFFRAPPTLPVVIEDAAVFVREAPAGSFDAVFVDFQDSAATPDAYLSEAFWIATVALLRGPRKILTNVASPLHLGPDWPQFRLALGAAGLDSVALSEPFDSGHRLLISSPV